MPAHAKLAALSLILLAIAGCTPTTGGGGTGATAVSGSNNRFSVNIVPPRPAGDVRVALPAGAGSDFVVSRLQGLGLQVTSSSANVIQASGGLGLGLVNCGEIRQTAFGNRSSVPGTSPVLTIYTNSSPPELIVRRFDYDSNIRVDLIGNQARVTEQHSISVGWETGAGQPLQPASATIGLGEATRFTDGTTCTTSGRVSQALR